MAEMFISKFGGSLIAISLYCFFKISREVYNQGKPK
ncbi:hypothetical protein T4C_5608 [Trichinella pseudospiralis]|uniref:Uncharacterized protein n=1 Tax=Trichinella pseudospiralis TaxID=6337 RepID=A0A0V1HHD5_TRIPS|nr:hypothetical protein T4C_5608 [Trichinella pseudospiralis]